MIHAMTGMNVHFLLSPPGDGPCRSCRGEPGPAGGSICPSAECHTPACAAYVTVAGPDPRSDRHPRGHAAPAAAGHTTAGTHTLAHTGDH